MAMDMFISIGDIKGESEDKTHKGKIDVLAWSWGMSNSGDPPRDEGGGEGGTAAKVPLWVVQSTAVKWLPTWITMAAALHFRLTSMSIFCCRFPTILSLRKWA